MSNNYFPGFTKLLVVGGLTPSGRTNEVEVIDLEISSTTCENVANFPFALSGAVGGLKDVSNPLICGGYPYNKDCYLLNDDGEWEAFGLMNEMRLYAALSQSPYPTEGQSFFVTGGMDEAENVTKTVEILKGNKWDESPEMPVELRYHCTVLLNSTTVMVIGGMNKTTYSSEVFYFNSNSEKWTKGPPLNKPRPGLSCGRVRKNSQSHQFSVIVVGGFNGGHLSSVEVFDEENGVWNYGPNFPIGINIGTLIEDPTGGVLKVGGEKENADDRFSDAIYRLPHAGPDAEWVKMPQKLSTGKHRHVAFLVPDDIATCQPSLN